MTLDEDLTALRTEVEQLRARVRELARPSPAAFSQFAIEHLPDPAYWIAEDGTILYANRAAVEQLGFSMESLRGMRMYEINVDLDPANWPAIWALLKASGSRRFEARHRHEDGRILHVEVTACLQELGGKEYSCAFIRDLSEMKRLEQRLRQAEKMEAIGRLAGGVAHDFNNQLAGIMGYAELLKHAAADNDQVVALSDQLCQVVSVAAELTARLLAFARQGKYLTAPVDLHRLIGEVVAMCSRSIDKSIDLRTALSAQRHWTTGDAAQLQSALLNLALNARDALPEGGTITLSTRNVEFTEESAVPAPGLALGTYVVVEVRDTGVGMTHEVQARIFEPFFTTKDTGAGTGLGLAAVYGTATNHKGAVEVDSTPGEGSVFRFYLPAARAGRPSEAPDRDEPSSLRLHGHVMVVDDESAVRKVTTEVLEALGCSVVAFTDGESALAYFREHHEHVDVVLLDLIMPGMSGAATFTALREIDPTVQALLVSGFTLDGQAQQLIEAGAKSFLQKPFSMAELAGKMRALLPVS